MDKLVFFIVHHATSQLHSDVLTECISSIRKFHNNQIIVIKTSTTNVINYGDNVSIVNTVLDGSHIFGALCKIYEYNINDYIFMHDGMILLKPITEEVLEKRFYYLWDFNFYAYNLSNNVLDMVKNTILSDDEKQIITERFWKEFRVSWLGLFGPAFGGNMETLRLLVDTLNIRGNLELYTGRNNLMAAEIFLPLIVTHLQIIDGFDDRMSLNGPYTNHPLRGVQFSKIDDIKSVINHHKYNGYMWKVWLGRE